MVQNWWPESPKFDIKHGSINHLPKSPVNHKTWWRLSRRGWHKARHPSVITISDSDACAPDHVSGIRYPQVIKYFGPTSVYPLILLYYLRAMLSETQGSIAHWHGTLRFVWCNRASARFCSCQCGTKWGHWWRVRGVQEVCISWVGRYESTWVLSGFRSCQGGTKRGLWSRVRGVHEVCISWVGRYESTGVL